MNDQQQKIDILYVITKSNWGGAQRYVYDMATAAHERYRVAVALGGNGMLADTLRAADISVHEVASFQRDISVVKELKAFAELFRLYRSLKPGIVHLNSSKAGGLGALAAQLSGVPKVVYTSHGLPFEEDRPSWQKALIAFLTWLTFCLCDTVIIITEANMRKAQRMPFVGGRCVLIRLGIAPVVTLSQREARARLAERCGMPKTTKKTAWVGTIAEYHPNKGLHYLIEAIDLVRAKHRDIVCVAIGGGELEETLRREIIARNLPEHVFLAGFVENAAMYLSAFDIVALPSIKEGLPYTLLEAGSAGSTFVGSGIPGIQEVVIDMESGIVVRPKQPKEIAGALELLIEDPKRRALYGRALQTRVDTEFSLRDSILKTRTLYAQLLPKPSRQGRTEPIG